MAEICLSATAEDGTLTMIQTNHFTWIVDEPRNFGGKGVAPSPVEMLLAAFAGCIVATGRNVAQEMGIDYLNISVQVTGQINSDVFLGINAPDRAGFSVIYGDVVLDTDAGDNLLEEWRKYVVARCPVIDNLCSETSVDVSVRRR